MCCVVGLLGMASQRRLSSRRMGLSDAGCPLTSANGVCTSFLGAAIITLSTPGGDGRPAMYAWQVFLFIISFLTMKGLFVGQDVEHTERYREENKSCPNSTMYEWLLLTIRCFHKLFPHAYHAYQCPPSLPSSLFFPSFFSFFCRYIQRITQDREIILYFSVSTLSGGRLDSSSSTCSKQHVIVMCLSFLICERGLRLLEDSLSRSLWSALSCFQH